ncbi:telomere resolvase [Trichocoleus desertorum AS-A10]|uniref:protelomerase family protein n=1 Tax=Trichocoleus desertorum TaxID=1481672 RepID=UPI00329988EE
MGKRAWLSNLIDNDYLPAIALLSDSPRGRTKAQQLVTRMRQEWSDRGALALNQQQSLMDQTRRAIKDHFGEDHFSLDYIKFSTEEYTQLNDEKQRSVSERNEDVKPLHNPDGIVATAVRLLESPEWSEVAAALAVLTGRRSSELLSTAKFEPKTRWSVVFTGALKRGGETQTLSFEIPTLTTSEKVCQALAKIRRELPETQELPAKEVNARFGPAVAAACDRHFSDLVPPRAGGNLYTHLFRAVYATIATFWYCPPKVDPVEFRAAIQGHYAVLDEHNPELRRSLAASRHYADFEIADSVIAQYAGKRKGIKLGLGGIQPIAPFQDRANDTQIGERRRQQRTSLRIWKDDQAAIASILEHFDGKLQPDKMSAWVAWSLQQLTTKATAAELEETAVDEAMEVELVEAIATTATEESADETETIETITTTSETTEVAPEPIEESEVSEPIQSTKSISNLSLEQPVANGLESKLDKLIDVMAQFVQFQLQAQQKVGQEDSPPHAIAQAESTRVAAAPEIEAISQPAIARAGTTTLPAPVPEQVPIAQPAIANLDMDTAEEATGERKPRKYRTGEADAIVNQAIDAIMAHNNLPNQLHDLKWAITINGLKNFSTNQRVIERIMQERKDELDKHHQLHQLLPGHNNRHKRKRKIGDVVRV